MMTRLTMDDQEKVRRARAVVKFMKGRGGEGRTLDPAEAVEEVTAFYEGLAGRLADLGSRIARCDEVLMGIRRALLRTQPSMYGRLDVRWWRGGAAGGTGAGVSWRQPVVVKQGYGPGGRLLVTPLKRPVNAPTNGAFALNADIAERMLRGFREVLRIRKRLRAEAVEVQRIMNRNDRRWEADEEVLLRLEGEAGDAYLEAVERMRANGYRVDGVVEGPEGGDG